MKIAQDMQVNVAGLRRNLKNIAHNYSEAQVKVREATSNDPWGPSSTLMTEIAELTYNVVAFTEIMQMIWKRLNDHGRNWRHVYKALTLLEYIIKTGTERVAQQCSENIFAIKTLTEFQYLEEGKDKGVNVREKAKQLVNLLKDSEKLKNERAKALKAKERFVARTGNGFGSDDGQDSKDSVVRNSWNDSGPMPVKSTNEIESARPQTVGEEELQLQLALAMSREEADQEELKRKSDDIRLQMALSESQQELKHKASSSLDLLEINLNVNEKKSDPWSMSAAPDKDHKIGFDLWPKSSSRPATSLTASTSLSNGFSSQSSNLPLTITNTAVATAVTDPWQVLRASPAAPVVNNKPTNLWSPVNSPRQNGIIDDFDLLSKPNSIVNTSSSKPVSDPFDFSALNLSGSPFNNNQQQKRQLNGLNKSPHNFLGENSALVNLESLITTSETPATNKTVNPFVEIQAPPPTINQLKQQQYQQETPSPPLQIKSLYLNAAVPVGCDNNNSATTMVQDPWAPIVNHSTVTTSTTTTTTSSVWNQPFTLDNKPNPFLL